MMCAMTGASMKLRMPARVIGINTSRAKNKHATITTPISKVLSTDEYEFMFSYKRGAIPVGSLKGDCAPCHGAGGAGAKGYPNLVDNKWLWGGKLDDIAQTITHGARAGDDAGRQGSMPAFGREGLLKPDEISTVADYVRSLSGLKTELGADLARGGKIFADNCAVCHGPQGKGNRERARRT